MREDVSVLEASADDELDVRRVLDAAMLETDAVSDAVDRGEAFVAVADGRVVGALVLAAPETVEYPEAVAGNGGGMHVDAVAVRRRRRGQGVGRALVEAALAREQRLTVAFDADVAAFYDALEFSVVAESEGRRWATRSLDACG